MALIIVGIIVAVIGFAVEAAIAVAAGVGILGGVIISGLFSWISGNELFGDEMLLDMLFGDIAGAISACLAWQSVQELLPAVWAVGLGPGYLGWEEHFQRCLAVV
ncbi:hypothetical protein [Thermoactinomyces mirandus]|uniref:Uncharacterized protein n=1 Tax=Thermoactinomyces mirandus TaxID=2756294 RepID=A0A7W1XRV3_9BACL|nr:hypothetical protein [Thermoactinomyces mirandus]MBA4601976.1 hypothetical protein [Thermoactinomyces mirandus]